MADLLTMRADTGRRSAKAMRGNTTPFTSLPIRVRKMVLQYRRRKGTIPSAPKLRPELAKARYFTR